ncbi:hypothetical protein MUK42_18616 [Musa troglodytarum]|uniref:Uncharacterized protein n=1 Tax=Musa troglodytarum TaxID=320322 RepID=A0A9E7FZ33_9LILI|nr:hypothetical protein MUK42_18616 [Musa troglodytarum]
MTFPLFGGSGFIEENGGNRKAGFLSYEAEWKDWNENYSVEVFHVGYIEFKTRAGQLGRELDGSRLECAITSCCLTCLCCEW